MSYAHASACACHQCIKARVGDPPKYICWDMVSERVDGHPITAEDHTMLLSEFIKTAEAHGYTFGGVSQRKTETEMNEWPEGAV